MVLRASSVVAAFLIISEVIPETFSSFTFKQTQSIYCVQPRKSRSRFPYVELHLSALLPSSIKEQQKSHENVTHRLHNPKTD